LYCNPQNFKKFTAALKYRQQAKFYVDLLDLTDAGRYSPGEHIVKAAMGLARIICRRQAGGSGGFGTQKRV
jgi:hypothetical protein